MPTKIEWCDETFNPWWGCERVSPGCAHCYAATFSRRLGMDHLWPRRPSVSNGQIHSFRFFDDKHWTEPLKWARTLPAKFGRRPRVFCASMADVFEERDELRGPRFRLLSLIYDTPELDWLVLTKRPEFARDFLRKTHSHAKPWDTPLPANLWIGASIETARQTYRADVLREIPATIRFISAEPLLGSLCDVPSRARPNGELGTPRELTASRPDSLQEAADASDRARDRAPLDLTGIGWLIIGGESGQGARPFHLEHARELLSARSARVWRNPPAVFVKQLGSRPVGGIMDGQLALRDAKGGDVEEWPRDLRIREWPSVASQPVLEAV